MLNIVKINYHEDKVYNMCDKVKLNDVYSMHYYLQKHITYHYM